MAQSMLDQLANAYLARGGRVPRQPRASRPASSSRSRASAQVLRHLPRRQGRARRSRAEAATPRRSRTRSASTRSSARRAAATTARSVDSIVVGIVTNNSDPEKLGRVKVKFPDLTEQDELLGPGHPAVRRQGARALDAAGRRRAGGGRVRERRPVVPLRARLGVQRQGHAGRGARGRRTARSRLKSDHKALIAAQEDITLRTEKGKWIIEVNGGEITETVKSPGNYTGDASTASTNAHHHQGDHGRVEAGRDHQGAADHARGAGLDVDQGRGQLSVEAQSSSSSRARRFGQRAGDGQPSPAASSTSDRFGSR